MTPQKLTRTLPRMNIRFCVVVIYFFGYLAGVVPSGYILICAHILLLIKKVMCIYYLYTHIFQQICTQSHLPEMVFSGSHNFSSLGFEGRNCFERFFPANLMSRISRRSILQVTLVASRLLQSYRFRHVESIDC